MMKTNNAKPRSERLRARAERLVATARDASVRTPGDDDAIALQHELDIHGLELELQNDELRESQIALEASRARYVELFDLAPVGYLTLDSAGIITDANATAALLFRTTRSGLVRQPFTAFVQPDEQDTFYLLRKELLATAAPQCCELTLSRRGARPFAAGLDARTVENQDGTPALHITLSDISARKAAEKALRAAADELEERVVSRTADLVRSQDGLRSEIARRAESELRLQQSEEQLRAILDTASEAIITADEHGCIHLFNNAAVQMFGWEADEIRGKNVNLLMPPTERERHDGYIARHLLTGERRVPGRPRLVHGLRKDGTAFPLELSLSEFQAEPVIQFTAILRDLTERQRLEDEFREAQKMAAIARLASGIAHDFNNLLMGIIGCCNVATTQLPAAHGAALALGEIKSAAERGAALTRELLTFGRQKATPAAPMPLNGSVRTVVGMLGNVLGEDIKLELDLSPTEPIVLGDPMGLEQILLNLAVNSRDAMKGGGRLRVATTETERATATATRSGVLPAGRYVELAVADTGCGIAPEIQAKVFEPFFTTKPIGEGSGLGLYSVFGIVERFGGAVELRSELGRGTEVRIVLPHLPSAPAAQAEERSPRRAPSTADFGQARMTVLMVEDEHLIRLSVKHMLSTVAFNVLMAPDCATAERIAAEQAGTIDVLLTDIVLTDGSGGALAEQLQLTYPAMAVVFMSAYPTDMLLHQERIPPGSSSLQKPFDEAQLRAALYAATATAADDQPAA